MSLQELVEKHGFGIVVASWAEPGAQACDLKILGQGQHPNKYLVRNYRDNEYEVLKECKETNDYYLKNASTCTGG